MLDYNSRLKHKPNKGQCGDEEMIESDERLRSNVDMLAAMVKASRYTVVITGAGISTSAGISDFRGPAGVWTREMRGESIPLQDRNSDAFNSAVPTLTHNALKRMMEQGWINHVISQNVDGLHLRSGLPPEHLSELHGNVFMEVCTVCGNRYLRNWDVGGMGLKLTGNECDDSRCRGPLRDAAIDWDTELPKEIFARARAEIRNADLVICLGSSLRIRPAGNLPLGVLRKNKKRDYPGKLAIVNLQKTHLDRKASLRIHHFCDNVMALLCTDLGIHLDHDTSAGNAMMQRAFGPAPEEAKSQGRKRKRT